MKIIAWNVNSIRALIKKEDLEKFFKKYKPDIICFSETKLPNKLCENTVDVKYIDKSKYNNSDDRPDRVQCPQQ